MTAPYYVADGVTVFQGDCIQVMRGLPDASIDAIVTDPPYGLEFMGKAWDNFGAGFNGGGTSATKNAPSFGGEGANASCASCGGRMRGANRCRCAAPDFRVKGEPVTRGSSTRAAMHAFEAFTYSWATEALRVLKPGGHLLAFGGSRTWHRLAAGIEDAGFEIRDSIAWLYGSGFPKSLDVSKAIDKAAGAEREIVGTAKGGAAMNVGGDNARPWHERQAERGGEYDVTAPATAEAVAWKGWHTALKPAFEPIVVARKPLAGTVVENVLAHGTGALNIDANRVGSREGNPQHRPASASGVGNGYATYGTREGQEATYTEGRYAPNVLLEQSQADALDAQTGILKSGANPTSRSSDKFRTTYGKFEGQRGIEPVRGADEGGASRFFPTFRYEAKAPTAERPKAGEVAHPTVKPLDLMRWLVRLVTPPNGTVLEPFAGSGTTLEAALLEGFSVIGIEREADYLPLIRQRISKPLQQSLFGDWDGAA